MRWKVVGMPVSLCCENLSIIMIMTMAMGFIFFFTEVQTKIYRIRISRGNNMIICVKWGKGPYLWYVKIASIRGFSRAVFYPTGDLLHWGMKSRYPTGYNQDNQLCSLSVVAVNGCQSIDEFYRRKIGRIKINKASADDTATFDTSNRQ